MSSQEGAILIDGEIDYWTSLQDAHDGCSRIAAFRLRQIDGLQEFLRTCEQAHGFSSARVVSLKVSDFVVGTVSDSFEEIAVYLANCYAPVLVRSELVEPGIGLSEQFRRLQETESVESKELIHAEKLRRQEEAGPRDVVARLPVARKTQPRKKKLEIHLEAELLEWMDREGIEAEQQVGACGKRTDIWMPGICFLELKRGQVNGDDVCQAAKYYQLFSKPVVLIGEKLTYRAGEGIAAINTIAGVDALCFITWSGARTYITALSDKASK
jgi:hypothetical protein